MQLKTLRRGRRYVMIGAVLIAAADVAEILIEGVRLLPVLGLISMALLFTAMLLAEREERNRRTPLILSKPPSFRREVMIPFAISVAVYLIAFLILIGPHSPWFQLGLNALADIVTFLAFWGRYRIWRNVPRGTPLS